MIEGSRKAAILFFEESFLLLKIFVSSRRATILFSEETYEVLKIFVSSKWVTILSLEEIYRVLKIFGKMHITLRWWVREIMSTSIL